jgi:hypothetical protein
MRAKAAESSVAITRCAKVLIWSASAAWRGGASTASDTLCLCARTSRGITSASIA